MPNRSTDTLFQLIQSLERAEKRHFKLFMKTDAINGDLKVVQLFDALDKMTHYDEEVLLQKNDFVQKSQLSNLKARLYQEVLASLRDLKKDSNIDLQFIPKRGTIIDIEMYVPEIMSRTVHTIWP